MLKILEKEGNGKKYPNICLEKDTDEDVDIRLKGGDDDVLLGWFNSDGLTLNPNVKDTLEDQGYGTDFTSWNEDGSIKVSVE